MAGGSSGRDEWAVTGLGPGSVVAGYRVEARIGAGGMAMVLRARDEALGRTVALKILPPASADDIQFRERFIRESRAVAAVDHPHIIPVYAAGEASGVLYLAMRYVAGGDLRSVVRREGPLPGERAVALLSPIASALDAAHRAALVHRDVKPANILVDTGPDRPEHPYLSDFGLAKGSVSSAGLTGTGQYLGTPDYSAPEQISGKGTGPRTDQYALACVAYAVLTGTPPFARDESMAVLWAHMYEQPPSVTARRRDLPAAGDQVIARALSKAPEERYATCTEFMTALRAALAQQPSAGYQRATANSGSVASEAASWHQPAGQDSHASSSLTQDATPNRPMRAGQFPTDPGTQSPFQSPSIPPVAAATGARAPRSAWHGLHGQRSRWPIVTGALVLLVLLIGGGAYGFWQYNQSQYYVGVSPGGFVSVYRGTNQSLAGISLSSFLFRTPLKVSMLTSADQAALQQTVTANSLDDAKQRIDRLQTEVTGCQSAYQRLAAWQTQHLAYQAYLVVKARATNTKTKAPTPVPNPGPVPQLPSAGQCASSTAFGIPASALPVSGSNASPTVQEPAVAPSPSTVTVDVYNGSAQPGLGASVSAALVAKGYKAGAVMNATAQTQVVTPGTQVFYGAGAAASGAKIAGYFGTTAMSLSSLPAGHVEVLLGTGSNVVPTTLASASSTAAATSTS